MGEVGLAHVQDVFARHDVLHPDVAVGFEAAAELGGGGVDGGGAHPADVGVLQVGAVVGAELGKLIRLVDEFVSRGWGGLHGGRHFVVETGSDVG